MDRLFKKFLKFWDPVDISRDIHHVRVSQPVCRTLLRNNLGLG